MHHDILGPDRGEAIAAVVANALGKTRPIGREQQLRTLIDDELLHIDDPEQTFQRENVGPRHVEFGDQEVAQTLVHRVVHGQADHRPPAPALQGRFEDAHQVFRLFLDLHVAVADHPEDAGIADLEARKHAVQVEPHDLFDPDKAHRLAGQTHEPVDLVRQGDQAIEGLAVLGAEQLQHHGETQVGDERKGMRGIDRDRRQDRKDLFCEIGVQPDALVGRQLRVVEDRDVGLAQFAPQIAPAIGLLGHQVGDPLLNRGQLPTRSQTLLTAVGHAGLDLTLEAGHADHVEFVEVAGRDRQETHPLQQGLARVLGLAQHPLVESQPRQLAVDEAVRRRGIDGADGGKRGLARDRAATSRQGLPRRVTGPPPERLVTRAVLLQALR